MLSIQVCCQAATPTLSMIARADSQQMEADYKLLATSHSFGGSTSDT